MYSGRVRSSAIAFDLKGRYMKLTLRLKNGTTDKGYISDSMLDELEKFIADKMGYKSVSVIADEERVRNILKNNAQLGVFKRDYKFENVKSYKIDYSELTDDEQHSLDMVRRAYETDAHMYAIYFYVDTLGKVFPKEEFGMDFEPLELPITFWTNDAYAFGHGGHVHVSEKYASIHVTLNSVSFNERIQINIRHELIHFALWYVGLPNEDDTVEFYCLASALNANPYTSINDKWKAYADLFEKFANENLHDIPMEDAYRMLGKSIAAISKSHSSEEYQARLNELVNEIKQLKK